MVNAITSGDILSAEQLKRHSKVYAGPGAGKTYFLVENVKNIITTKINGENCKICSINCPFKFITLSANKNPQDTMQRQWGVIKISVRVFV